MKRQDKRWKGEGRAFRRRTDWPRSSSNLFQFQLLWLSGAGYRIEAEVNT